MKYKNVVVDKSVYEVLKKESEKYNEIFNKKLSINAILKIKLNIDDKQIKKLKKLKM